MMTLVLNLWPELLLIATACLLLVMGSLGGAGARRLAPVLAVIALLLATAGPLLQWGQPLDDRSLTNSVGGGAMAQFFKILAGAAGLLFVLLAWPTSDSRTDQTPPLGSNGALAVGGESAEYFSLLLLSIAGLMLTAGANNLILLFLAIELASIPTYIMVSISRPLPAAQEAGLKYFFLGALSAALMLLGFSYLYGATGAIHLQGNGSVHPGIVEHFNYLLTRGSALTSLEILAIVLVLAGFAFKMAAVPLHAYVADVYQGAATPLTAMLSVVPKAAGLAALLKVLIAVGGTDFKLPVQIITLLAIIAALTMTVGNVLALLQFNVKRVMAYSSVAHSGYLLAGVTAMLATTGRPGLQIAALGATLFYIAAYAIMNTGVFAVLQQLPARKRFGETASDTELLARGQASAEVYEDLAGQGRAYPVLGLVMTICALSLVGIPATAGFMGKLLLGQALLSNPGLLWLLIALMLNAAISAAYYLRLPAAMFFRPPSPNQSVALKLTSPPAMAVALLCAFGTLALGVALPLANHLSTSSRAAADNAITGQPVLSPTEFRSAN
jgi:NADH-quinone oxidoreductase subunit N